MAGVVLVVLLVFLTGQFSGDETRIRTIEARIARAEQQVRELTGRAPANSVDAKALDELTARVAKLEAGGSGTRPPVTDPALANRMATLEGTLKSLEEKIGVVARRTDDIDLVARDAYVDVAASQWKGLHLTKGLGATALGLASKGQVLQVNQQILRHNHAPVLLIGEPGVGKSTWLTRFFAERDVRQEFYSYRLDASTMYPALVPTELVSYVQHSLCSGVVEEMRAVSERLGVGLANPMVLPR